MKNQSAARTKVPRNVVKLGASRQVVIPKAIHDRLGLHPGDYLEVRLNKNRVVLTPQTLVERRLAEALEDLAEGRVHGPFASAREMIKRLRERSSTR
jgi:AbrB family looped-hinge helix DNA binding protein